MDCNHLSVGEQCLRVAEDAQVITVVQVDITLRVVTHAGSIFSHEETCILETTGILTRLPAVDRSLSAAVTLFVEVPHRLTYGSESPASFEVTCLTPAFQFIGRDKGREVGAVALPSAGPCFTFGKMVRFEDRLLVELTRIDPYLRKIGHEAILITADNLCHLCCYLAKAALILLIHHHACFQHKGCRS